VLTEADTRLAAIITEQEEIFTRRQPRSAEYAAAATSVLAGGVTSNWQITQPQPVWLSHGKGGKVYDVDGNEYVDLHGGYGGPALNALGSIMLAMSLIIVIIGYVGYRLLTRGERGGGLAALTAISGEGT
jgi:hypothetical protein